MQTQPSIARIMVTDWHSLIPLLISFLAIIWTAVYPFLDPAHFQLQGALDSAALAIIAFILSHAHAINKQQALMAGIGNTRPVQVPPHASRNPYGD